MPAHYPQWLKRHYLLFVTIGGLIGFMILAGWFLWPQPFEVLPPDAPVTVRRNIRYCNANSLYQSFDMYRPSTVATSTVLPLVVYVHGGGWQSGSKQNTLIAYYAKLFASRNIATISVAYRLRAPNPYPDQNDDVACALQYVEQHAGGLRVNPDKMVFFGDSAGGDLAAFAALNIPYKQYDYDAPRGVIDFYGVSDFSKIIGGTRPDFNARRYLGSRYNQVASAASPTSYVSRRAPRLLLVHGTKDTIVPIAQSQEFYHRLKGEGIDADYVAVPGAGHGFVGPELGSKDNQMIQNAVTSFLQETIGS